MTEAFDVAQWAKNWEALTRQFQSAMGTPPPAPSPWSMPANPFAGSWGDAFSNASPMSGAQANMQAAAQSYMAMLQTLMGAAAQQGSSSGANPFADAFKNMPGIGGFDVGSLNNPFAGALRGMSNQASQSFDQIVQRMAAAAGPMFDQGKAGLAFPAFGPAREKQEQAQKAIALWIDFQEHSARFNRLLLRVSEDASKRFQLKLAEREEPGRQIESVKGLYDLWVDAYEDAYAEVALSEEYREIYAALIGAQMRVREHMQAEVERACVEIGMPTRSEVDTLGERLQALRREYRNDREELGDIAALKSEVEALRREVEALKRGKGVESSSNVVELSERTKRSAKSEESSIRIEVSHSPAHKPAPKRAEPAATKKASAPQRKERKAAKSTKGKVDAKKSARSFAASIARFANDSKTGDVAASAKMARSKLSKR